MMFGMAAATSALDLIATLTKPQGASKPKPQGSFEVGTQTQASAQAASLPGQSSLISPGTMNALFASQNGNETSASGRAAALQSLFGQIDGDGNGQISAGEFQTALGAGGTNSANADKVFGKLDNDGDGNVSMAELSSALKPKKKPHGPQHNPQDMLLKALDSAKAVTAVNSEGTNVWSSPAALGEAARSYNAVSRMSPHLVDMITKGANASSSLSISV